MKIWWFRKKINSRKKNIYTYNKNQVIITKPKLSKRCNQFVMFSKPFTKENAGKEKEFTHPSSGVHTNINSYK